MDIEKEILPHLTNSDSIQKVWDLGLRENVFVDPVNRAVFKFAFEYWSENGTQLAPTADVLKYEFPDVELDEPQESIPWLVEKLKERHLINKLEESVREIAKTRVDDPDKAIRRMIEDGWDLLTSTTPRETRIELSETIERRRSRYREASQFTGEIRGIPSGFTEVDQHTFGLLPGELGVTIGYTGRGKSHLLGYSAVAARKAGYTPLIITMELSKEEFEDRIDAYISGLPGQEIQKGRLAIDEIQKLHRCQDEFAELGPFHIEKPPIGDRNVTYITNLARQLNADVIYIDQLSFLEGRENRYQDTKDKNQEILLDLKGQISDPSLGKMLPVNLAVQFNREAAQQKGARGALHNIAQSSFIEQTADLAFSISSTDEQRRNKSSVFEMLKFRRGDLEAWLLEWDLKERTRFSVRQVLEGD